MSNPESMSNEELDQAVAVEVMGWTRSNKPGWEVWWISGTVGVEVADRWHPSTSIEAAMAVEERIDKLANYMGNVVERVVASGNTTISRGCPLREIYVLRLVHICNPRLPEFEMTTMGENNWFGVRFQSNQLWAIIHATPRERCLAALTAARGAK